MPFLANQSFPFKNSSVSMTDSRNSSRDSSRNRVRDSLFPSQIGSIAPIRDFTSKKKEGEYDSLPWCCCPARVECRPILRGPHHRGNSFDEGRLTQIQTYTFSKTSKYSKYDMESGQLKVNGMVISSQVMQIVNFFGMNTKSLSS